ncbi:fumarylacetoacetate hydrolase family protein [Bordetella avium]|uniref:Dioxygenase n=1 Tax=Bordetella avium (strain 197N) TaxID=360910 RepID=Q2L2A6_BORA1|nr:fumarylacetoacetate hydrolase family protein [Bordetella avium]AZY47716.1 FAA hydrolase family protein [Bordetella avium]AZY51086.1 FAA hydrolase family protein [Bordetella avium]RIQ15058.1 FAA hydrolase family protein [Bordetella avium]RIQ18451.1 FAA hydrolase family protein [Bordetella avium]RIQ35512.1 FAA hydrolase family protein [Bordetella avium]
MKLISFEHQGRATYGAVVGNDVWDLGQTFGEKAPDLKSLIACNMQADAAQVLASQAASLKFDQLTLLPVVPNPGKILCIGLNYGEHVRETGKTITESPVIFMRLNESQVAHGQDIVRPPESSRLDYEGEIAIVIGQGGRRISEADAWNHIAGYSCYNDGSIRDWQVATSQWGPGKNFWRTGGFGPWMVTSDEIAPNQKMTLTTRLNGQVMQQATTDMMIHSIPRQIAYISTFIPLEAGDVIVTGTPGGVGNKRTPPVFMQPGDIVEIEVDAVGILRNGIRDE